jgi:Flp pilus assembly protein TadG
MKSLARRLLRLCRCPEGAAVLEFGIVAPVLIMIMMGVVEFGRLHWVRNSIEYAAEQTARWAIVNTAASDDQIKAHAKAEFDGISAGKAKVNVARDTANGLSFLTVIVTYDFQFLADFAGIGTLSLRSETRVPLI